MVGDWATRCHVLPTHRCVVAVVEEKSRAWRSVTQWLSSRLLPACKSGDGDPNGGVIGRNGAVAVKVHWRVFFLHCRGLTMVEDSGASWDNGCDGRNKRQPLSGLSELRTR